ncbi:hypothetical protein PG985_012631 [Apiospora marii]|uniref:uncharacterized protein n=1 Tax=Apiospora marii TaxID=335849 RepID=UPI003131B6F0
MICPLKSPDFSHQAGCTFDVLFHGYLSDLCIDHNVYQYWHRGRVGDLEWRESDESAQPIATPEILRGDVAHRMGAGDGALLPLPVPLQRV